MYQLGTQAYVALANHWREIRDADRERGLTTTELAVLTFILVAIAIGVGTILFQYATGQADALPENPTENFDDGGAGIPDADG